MFRIYDGRKTFYQWDLDRQLIVEVECTEVHFTQDGISALVLAPYKLEGVRVVDVPNILLQSVRPITVYAYIEEPDGGYTKCGTTLYVVPRAKPDDYVYTETEVLTWRSLEERVEKLEQGGGGGGGGKWELLNDVTAESVASVELNCSDDGTPYNLIATMAVVTYSNVTTSYDGTRYEDDNVALLVGNSVHNFRCAVFRTWSQYGHVQTERWWASNNDKSNWSEYATNIPLDTVITDYKNVTKIKITIPSGQIVTLRVRVWGVRA